MNEQIKYLALAGHSVAEIARQTSTTPSAVRWQLQLEGLGTSQALIKKRKQLFRFVREEALNVADQKAKAEIAEWLGSQGGV